MEMVGRMGLAKFYRYNKETPSLSKYEEDIPCRYLGTAIGYEELREGIAQFSWLMVEEVETGVIKTIPFEDFKFTPIHSQQVIPKDVFESSNNPYRTGVIDLLSSVEGIYKSLEKDGVGPANPYVLKTLETVHTKLKDILHLPPTYKIK